MIKRVLFLILIAVSIIFAPTAQAQSIGSKAKTSKDGKSKKSQKGKKKTAKGSSSKKDKGNSNSAKSPGKSSSSSGGSSGRKSGGSSGSSTKSGPSYPGIAKSKTVTANKGTKYSYPGIHNAKNDVGKSAKNK